MLQFLLRLDRNQFVIEQLFYVKELANALENNGRRGLSCLDHWLAIHLLSAYKLDHLGRRAAVQD